MPKILGNLTPPKLSTAERDSISWTSGAVIYNVTLNKLEYYDGSLWNTLEAVQEPVNLFAITWAANTLMNC